LDCGRVFIQQRSQRIGIVIASGASDKNQEKLARRDDKKRAGGFPT